jgi:predicted Zn-dependent protease with MMP-like domain
VFETTPEAFESMVRDAIERLPPTFSERITNLDFAVEESASVEDHVRTRTPRNATLLGVYRGTPLTRRGSGYSMTLPDTIVIFSGPLQRLSRDEDDLRERIAHVVRHEIGHYFGISDDRLREIGAY